VHLTHTKMFTYILTFLLTYLHTYLCRSGKLVQYAKWHQFVYVTGYAVQINYLPAELYEAGTKPHIHIVGILRVQHG